MKFWAVYRASDGVLVQQFAAPTHPRFHGFAWESGFHVATEIPQIYDPAVWRWDVGTAAFVDNIEALRAMRWTIIKAARDAAEWGGCATALGRVDTDEQSQRKIVGAVTMAMIAAGAGQPFAITWTMQDNASVEHDGAAMMAMGAAVGTHVATCHAIGLAKRAAIDAAESREAIEAVSADDGWPGAI